MCNFSAHGNWFWLFRQEAKERFKVFDATYPLVTKVHIQVARASNRNSHSHWAWRTPRSYLAQSGQYDNDKGGIIYLVEDVEDIAKLTLRNDEDITFMTQTTLSIDDTADVIKVLKQKYPAIQRSSQKWYLLCNNQSTTSCVRELARYLIDYYGRF